MFFELQKSIFLLQKNLQVKGFRLFMQIIIDIPLLMRNFGLLMIHISLVPGIGQPHFLQKIESISILVTIIVP